MTFTFRLLRCRFFSTATINTSKSTAISKNLFKERNLKSLEGNFKHHSNSDRFQVKIGVSENNGLRVAFPDYHNLKEEILECHRQFYHDRSRQGLAIRLVTVYGKQGTFESAQKMFDVMPDWNGERTVGSMNAFLGACVNSGKFDEIEGFFRELPKKFKLKPDVVSYNTVIKGLCEKDELDKSISMVDEMEKNGLKPNLITFNTILEAFYSSNMFDDGEKIWSRMVTNKVVPNIRTCNVRLIGFVNDRRIEEAIKFLAELGSKVLKADIFSYGALIYGYCKEDNLEEVKRWYRELIENE
ncbi:hypothetical protein ACH5RR_014944 [Cinchona calisaya]|uniref:Pentatricopeptide repeat-containing protein n=1 Tax=Cinchona calisaya TaxID=153742 RepID=A0ABD2ZRQ1_9GENT